MTYGTVVERRSRLTGKLMREVIQSPCPVTCREVLKAHLDYGWTEVPANAFVRHGRHPDDALRPKPVPMVNGGEHA